MCANEPERCQLPWYKILFTSPLPIEKYFYIDWFGVYVQTTLSEGTNFDHPPIFPIQRWQNLFPTAENCSLATWHRKIVPSKIVRSLKQKKHYGISATFNLNVSARCLIKSIQRVMSIINYLV